MFTFLLLTALAYTANANDNGPINIQLRDENIIGGRVVYIKDYPYQVSIIDSDGYWCGGSILTNYHVLSAGHCVILGSPPLVVRAGSSFNSVGGSLHHVEYNVTYDSHVNYDVSVLRVTEPFVFDETRKPIELVSAGDEPKSGTLAVVTGWGVTQPKTVNTQLRAVDLPIIDRDTCNQIYKGRHIAAIVEGQICAGYIDGQKDACQGDSGSPLVINGKQVGIVSIGIGCTQRKTPGIYADVSYYSDWIKKQMAN